MDTILWLAKTIYKYSVQIILFGLAFSGLLVACLGAYSYYNPELKLEEGIERLGWLIPLYIIGTSIGLFVVAAIVLAIIRRVYRIGHKTSSFGDTDVATKHSESFLSILLGMNREQLIGLFEGVSKLNPEQIVALFRGRIKEWQDGKATKEAAKAKTKKTKKSGQA